MRASRPWLMTTPAGAVAYVFSGTDDADEDAPVLVDRSFLGKHGEPQLQVVAHVVTCAEGADQTHDGLVGARANDAKVAGRRPNS
jgi:hypothetical protein